MSEVKGDCEVTRLSECSVFFVLLGSFQTAPVKLTLPSAQVILRRKWLVWVTLMSVSSGSLPTLSVCANMWTFGAFVLALSRSVLCWLRTMVLTCLLACLGRVRASLVTCAQTDARSRLVLLRCGSVSMG